MNDWVADYPLGTVIAGQTTDLLTNVLINGPQLGRTYSFPISTAVANQLGLKDRDTGQRVLARLMRNTTGAALLPATTVTVEVDAGPAGLYDAATVGTTGARYTYIVDPDLPAAGVPDDDIFYAIIKGPTIVKVEASDDTTAGLLGIPGALGTVGIGIWGTTSPELSMGSFLAASTYDVDARIAFDMNPHWG